MLYDMIQKQEFNMDSEAKWSA